MILPELTGHPLQIREALQIRALHVKQMEWIQLPDGATQAEQDRLERIKEEWLSETRAQWWRFAHHVPAYEMIMWLYNRTDK